MSDILFIIAARGGSKGLPGKNLKRLGGISLVGRSVRLALQAGQQSNLDYRVVCSTDDEQIAEEASLWGAEIPRLRPVELATDTASSIDVLLSCVDFLNSSTDTLLVLLQPTSPLTELEDLIAVINMARESGHAVLSICEAEHPAAWQFGLDEQGFLIKNSAQKTVRRRQEAEISYRLNGAIYAAKIKQLIENEGFLNKKSKAYVMPAARSVDVDTAQDLHVAQALLEAQTISPVKIGDCQIGSGQPCFVIAEVGVNHNGDMDLAKNLIDAAQEAGADAVKFQSFKALKLVSATAPKAEYQKKADEEDQTQLKMIQNLQLSASQQRDLAAYSAQQGIMFLSSPFDSESLDELCELDIPAIKLGSGELTNYPFLAQVAAKGLPMILSTGMANMYEVDQALQIIRDSGDPPVILLHCVSSYPTPVEQCNLAAMDSLRQSFQRPTGWSDHTTGIEVSLAAVARGASVIEKHLTMDKKLRGPDHASSSEPQELQSLIQGIRLIEASIGSDIKQAQPCEIDTKNVARRSIHTARDMQAGEVIRAEDLLMLRPGTGIGSSRVKSVIGRALKHDVSTGQMLDFVMLKELS